MKFDIEITDLNKKGHVNATLTALNIADDETQTEILTIRYIIQFPTEKIVLHKMVKWGEWFPEVLGYHISNDIIKRSITEIEIFEKEKKPIYKIENLPQYQLSKDSSPFM
jgi:hypothetical protein